MAITYNAGTNVITVTGYTEGTPCNFTDIYNADVAGAWGVVTRQCTNQFCFAANLQIGDGSTVTYVADTLKHVIFTAAPYSNDVILIKTNAHLRFGKVESGKRTSSGCSVTYTYNAYGRISGRGAASTYLETYSSLLMSTANRLVGNHNVYSQKIYNCVYSKNVELAQDQCTTSDIYNLSLQNATYGFNYPMGTFDILYLTDMVNTIYISASPSPMLLKNVVYAGCSLIAYINNMTTNALYLVNTVSDNWVFSWNGTSSKHVYRQYEFDLKVIDKDNAAINGATVKIWDKDSTLIVDTTTNASGVIATQTITRGYYNQANGNTLQEASPHLIKIEKADYTTYEADFTLIDKTDWLIALQAAGGGLMRNPPMTGGMV